MERTNVTEITPNTPNPLFFMDPPLVAVESNEPIDWSEARDVAAEARETSVDVTVALGMPESDSMTAEDD